MNIVQNILKVAKSNGFNDSQICKLLNKNASYVSDWKCGKSKPKADELIILADYFKCSIDYLLTGKEYERTADFYRILLSDDGVNAIRYYLKNFINESDYETLENAFGLGFAEIKTFLDFGIQYGGRCLNILDRVLSVLELNVYDIFKECYRAENNSILSETERRLVDAYRSHAEMQAAVNKMLDIQPESTPIQEAVADTIGEQMEHALKTSKNNV